MSVETRFRRAKLVEAEQLTHLAMLSKQSWGYSDEFMHRVAGDMLVTEHDIAASHCIVAEVDGAIAAYLLVQMNGTDAFVRDLFVHPGYFRRGLGRALFEDAVRYARVNRASRITLTSDPNAQPFYERLGLECVGMVPSVAGNGRVLPVMAYKIS
jgi:GNAT superfamily N-acetyltransferase